MLFNTSFIAQYYAHIKSNVTYLTRVLLLPNTNHLGFPRIPFGILGVHCAATAEPLPFFRAGRGKNHPAPRVHSIERNSRAERDKPPRPSGTPPQRVIFYIAIIRAPAFYRISTYSGSNPNTRKVLSPQLASGTSLTETAAKSTL